MITKLPKENSRNTSRKKPRLSYNLREINGVGREIGEETFSVDEKIKIVINGQSNSLPIEELCAVEGISISTFNKWTKEFLSGNLVDLNVEESRVVEKDEKRFKVVIEGKSGETSVAEICRRENISHDVFLDWCEEFMLVRNRNSILRKLNNPVYLKNKSVILSSTSSDVVGYLENYVDLASTRMSVIEAGETDRIGTLNLFNIVDLGKINDVRFINKHLEHINSILPTGGFYVGCLETFTARKKRMKVNNIPVVRDVYFSMEFLIRRILPKVSFTKKYYFDITKGNDRLLSKAEGLGRLISCGFKIVDYKTIDGLIYYVVKKVESPSFDENPSYGPLYKMPRLGKNGKIIGVYKLRTMHPYSEYLQDYIVNAYGYADTGKPANDFRIPAWGKFMRRFWLDEVPQLINVLKGELKLVGIRPVSKRYFQDIPTEMQKLRITQKPGCIPPYVALNREGNVLSVLQAEKEYLVEKINNPYTTDLKYFFKAVFNILFKNKRSA